MLNPDNAAAKPLKLFNSEMTIGISAPPIFKLNTTENKVPMPKPKPIIIQTLTE